MIRFKRQGRRTKARRQSHLIEHLEQRMLLAAVTPFTFSLDGSYDTSAGVFNSTGTLVRTLWSGVRYTQGSHSATWDGNNDDGTAAPSGASYTIKVLTDNMQYLWQGAIGNTSDFNVGNNEWVSYDFLNDMSISGTHGYASPGYEEGPSGMRSFNISAPNTPSSTVPGDQNVTWTLVATDGTRFYIADTGSGWDKNNSTFVTSRNVSDNSIATFTSGSQVNTSAGTIYTNCVDVSQEIAVTPVVDTAFVTAHMATGLAVQGTGNILAVAHGGLNVVNLFDKTTGAAVGTISITAPGKMGFAPNGDLWVTAGTTVQRFAAATLGTTNTPVTTISGFSSALAVAVNPNNNDIVLVADGGTSQQVKAYTSTGGSLWTYGTAGGYATDPAVTNSKFWFADFRSTERYPVAPITPLAFLAFQTDGSFWVSDGGNARALHFDASRNYIGQIAYDSAIYTVEVDPNNPTRVFANWLEFKVDYSQPLTRDDPSSATGNKCWTLVDNWAAGIDRSYYTAIKAVFTLSAGGHTFTYAITQSTASTQYFYLIKLPASGPAVAVTSNYAAPMGNGQPHGDLAPNGDQHWALTSGGVQTITSRALQSIDSSGNLTYSSTTTTLATVPAGTNDPDTTGGVNDNPVSYPVTSSNIVVTYNATNNVSAGSYHIGGTPIGGTAYKFKTSKAAALTVPDGQGTYPTQNSYGGHSGTAVYTDGRNIIANYDGQKGTFSNQFYHYNDDGLLIGQFGTTMYGFYTNLVSAWGASTNYISFQIARASNGVLYVFTGDESYHSGINTWEVVGDKQVREFSATGTDGSNLTLAAPTTGTGLQGDYYTDSGSTHFATSVSSNTDTAINFTFPSSSVPAVPQSGFSARWIGQVLTTTTAGLYTFSTQSAGGVRLWIDGQLLIDNWTAHSLTTNNATITLSASTSYNIRLEYFNPLATAGSLNLMWTPPGGSQAIIPTANLFQARGQQPVGQNTGIPIAATNGGDLSTIVAANYDTGGAEDGYHVPGGGSVLIQSESDGTQSIGGVSAGEWLKYDVNVVSGGTYDLWVYAANGTTSTSYLHVEDMYGTNLTGSIPIAPTGGYHVPYYQTFLATVTLQPGGQWIKLVFDTSNGCSIESMTLTHHTTPFGGTAPMLPTAGSVNVEAENFDVAISALGNGIGVAYFDTQDKNYGSNPTYRAIEGENISNVPQASAGIAVRDLNTLEFLKFTVTVPAGGGTYNVGLRFGAYSTGIVGNVHLEDEIGRNLTGTINVYGNVVPSNYETLPTSVTLAGGTHVLKLVVDSSTENIDLDVITFTKGLTNLATGGTATASTGTAANGFDGNNATAWQTTAATGWLRYQFPATSTAVITQYKITSAYNIASFPGQAPLNWQFQGSNDGSTWTTLDTQYAPADILNSDTRTYTIPNTTAYTYYRINITANNGDPSAVEIGDLQLLPVALNVIAGTYNIAAPLAGAGIVPFYLGALSISSGAKLVLGTATASSDRTVLLLDTLSNAGSGNSWTGTLDLGGNDLILHTTPATNASVLTSINQQLQAGFNGGQWNGKGISSSTAASNTRHLTAIGMMPNISSLAFDNQPANTTDILLKYTYYGDATLDGMVDGSDYSRIDSAYLANQSHPGMYSGWFNGDFNYDGVINGSDYTLIDNAFNTQGAALTATIAPIAQPAAVLAAVLAARAKTLVFSRLPLTQDPIQTVNPSTGQWPFFDDLNTIDSLLTGPAQAGSSSAGNNSFMLDSDTLAPKVRHARVPGRGGMNTVGRPIRRTGFV